MNVQLNAGSTAGFKLTIFNRSLNSTQVGDNLTVPFTLGYSGFATGGVTYSVNTTGMLLTSPIVNK